MPLREYRCSACEEIIEVLQKMNERKPRECDNCGAKGTLEKEISKSAFHLKGGGWYKDLYASTPKSDDSKASNKKSSKASNKKEKSSSKSDNKSTKKASQ